MSKAERPTTTCGPFIFYKPKAVAVISTVLLVGMCLCLGIWQLQRLHWKEGLVAQLEENSAAQPMIKAHLPDNLDDLVNEPFRFISLPGEFKHEHEFHIAGRYRNGQVGYNIITPFEVADDGRQLLVNRGWVPLDKKAPEDRKEDPRFDGLVFMSGVIYVPEGNGRFLPDHDLKDNVWFWYDIPKMEEVAGIDLPPVIIEQVNKTPPPGTLPIPRESFAFSLRNDHLNYAFIWFSLALSGLVIFFIYHLKAAVGEEEE